MKDHGKSSAPHRPGKAAERSRDTARLEGDLRTIAYRLSHDLQTPLGGIIFSAEVLKQSLPENDPASAN